MPPDDPVKETINPLATSTIVTSPAPPPSELLSNPHVQQLLRSHTDALAAKEAAILSHQRELEIIKGQLAPLQAKLAERDEAEKKAKLAEMSEIERLNANLKETEAKSTQYETSLQAERAAKVTLEAAMAKREESQRNERDFFSLMAIKAISPNAYELRGLLEDVSKLAYANEEERTQRIQGVLDAFVTATGRKPTESQIGQQQSTQQTPGGLVVIQTPPGGQPPQGGQLLSDTYTEEQMMALARSADIGDRDLYKRIRDQRIAINKAKGIGPLRMKLGS